MFAGFVGGASFLSSVSELFALDAKEVVRPCATDAWGVQRQLEQLELLAELVEDSFSLIRVDLIPKLLANGAYEALVSAAGSSKEDYARELSLRALAMLVLKRRVLERSIADDKCIDAVVEGLNSGMRNPQPAVAVAALELLLALTSGGASSSSSSSSSDGGGNETGLSAERLDRIVGALIPLLAGLTAPGERLVDVVPGLDGRSFRVTGSGGLGGFEIRSGGGPPGGGPGGRTAGISVLEPDDTLIAGSARRRALQLVLEVMLDLAINSPAAAASMASAVPYLLDQCRYVRGYAWVRACVRACVQAEHRFRAIGRFCCACAVCRLTQEEPCLASLPCPPPPPPPLRSHHPSLWTTNLAVSCLQVIQRNAADGAGGGWVGAAAAGSPSTELGDADRELLDEVATFPSLLDYEKLLTGGSGSGGDLSDVAIGAAGAFATGVVWGLARSFIGLSRINVPNKFGLGLRVAAQSGAGGALLVTAFQLALSARKRFSVESDAAQAAVTGGQIALLLALLQGTLTRAPFALAPAIIVLVGEHSVSAELLDM